MDSSLRVRAIAALVSVCLAVAGCGGDDDDDDDDGGDDFGDWDGECEESPDHHIEKGTSWQWQLTEAIDTSLDVEMYDVDLFNVTDAEIEQLHSDGRVVICYFSAGSWEDWRDDAGDFPSDAIGDTLEGWEDERWLDVRSGGVREVMRARLDHAVDRGCDGVEPDNMDGYLNDPGFDFDGYDQLDYNAFIAEAAHERGLSVGLKNDVDQIEQLEPCYDWALNEECFAYDECGLYAPFLDAGKAVFHVEYVDEIADGQDLADEVCGDESIAGFSSLIKEWDLGPWRIACD